MLAIQTVITRVKCIGYTGKGILNGHLGSNSDLCYIQNRVTCITNRVIKRFRLFSTVSSEREKIYIFKHLKWTKYLLQPKYFLAKIMKFPVFQNFEIFCENSGFPSYFPLKKCPLKKIALQCIFVNQFSNILLHILRKIWYYCQEIFCLVATFEISYTRHCCHKIFQSCWMIDVFYICFLSWIRPTSAVLCPWARHFTPRKYWLITQEAMAPSRHDWKIVDWDVKPQHNQPNLSWI